MSLPTVPTPAGFLDFVRTQMAIPVSVLPDNSFFLDLAYEISLLTVNQWFAGCIPQIYVQMVYNLGGDILISDTVDLPAPPAPLFGPPPQLGYFANARRTWNVNGFVSGVINSASDNGTSESMVVADAFSALTIADLQNMKTPWGRQYLSWAQKFGPGIWGIS